ncbi:MAG: polysaccharide pyruvyl transferase family protein [Lachnospiraceae bacterium]|nr:polysaccharide pyruvyl transferase family protein [Lachnospiraceae bacterium]
MRICVVTVYNGSNYGARLQALALKHVLEEKGHTVTHVETGARNPRSRAVKKIIKRLITFDWRKDSLKFQWDTGSLFVQEAKEFDVCSIAEAGEADLVIFGSDEIWNVRRKMIYQYPVLFGKGIENDWKTSYAVSINDATVADFNKRPFSLEEIRKFKKITVRDQYSKDVLSSLLPEYEIATVVDPTFLPERSFYEGIMETPELDSYILIYSYGNYLTEDVMQQIQEFAKKKNLKIISVLGYFAWCNYNTPCSTKKVLGLFKNAEYVFTDTFHGAIFSMLFEKNFVVISRGTKKLDTLLDIYSLEDRKIQPAGRTIETIANQTIDYVSFNQTREELRRRSFVELDEILNLKSE